MPPVFIPQPLPGIKRVLAVASGKGGVGKSTVSCALAFSFLHQGFRVGLLDADIHGPSLPLLLDLHQKPECLDGKNLEPVAKGNLLTMSLGFLMAPDQATIWRGPMMHHALQQIIFNVNWGELDILIVDLPPGTGDVPLSLAQKILLEVLIVSTPQALAIQDARRALQLFRKVGTPILGFVENMGEIRCDGCTKKLRPWGEDALLREAKKENLPLLGRLSLDPFYQKPFTEKDPLPSEVLELSQALLEQLKKSSPNLVPLEK
ncbi:MAG: Mrp/NBP35 family ATP-binding protein [Holosporales bacterium]|nr:Mrp/NBP35 family ATP-binding protein [Holosporales bacterium]